MIKKALVALAVICAVFSLSSCGRGRFVRTVNAQKLFDIEYGNFEEQINLFGMKNPGNISTSIMMRDGFFYIVNGESNKILTLNSYGDLLSLNYKEDSYSTDNSGLLEKSTKSIWRPVEYPFNFNGKMAVDSRKYMYAVGTLPKERNEQNEKENLLYSQVILCFSSDGSVLDYLGQEGFGGTPFPFIKDIYTTENNDLVVVCVTTDGLCVYWFSQNGVLRYKIPVLTSSVPRISLDSINSFLSPSDLFVTVENVVPDPYAERLYIKIDYYLPHIDPEYKVQSGVDYIESLVYPLNIENGFYGEPVNISPYEESVTEDFSKLTYKLPYDFLGVVKNGWFFFVITTPEGFSVEMIQPGTQNTIKRQLNIKHSEVLYHSLSLSHEGIISALLAGKENIEVCWWRTDSLIDSIIKN